MTTKLYLVSYTVQTRVSAESPEQALSMVQEAGAIFDSATEDWSASLVDSESRPDG